MSERQYQPHRGTYREMLDATVYADFWADYAKHAAERGPLCDDKPVVHPRPDDGAWDLTWNPYGDDDY